MIFPCKFTASEYKKIDRHERITQSSRVIKIRKKNFIKLQRFAKKYIELTVGEILQGDNWIKVMECKFKITIEKNRDTRCNVPQPLKQHKEFQ